MYLFIYMIMSLVNIKILIETEAYYKVSATYTIQFV